MLYVDKYFFMFRDRDGTEKIPSRKKSQDYRCSMVPQSGWKNNGHYYNSFIAATVNEFVYYRTNNPPVLDIPMIVLNCQFITTKTQRYHYHDHHHRDHQHHHDHHDYSGVDDSGGGGGGDIDSSRDGSGDDESGGELSSLYVILHNVNFQQK